MDKIETENRDRGPIGSKPRRKTGDGKRSADVENVGGNRAAGGVVTVIGPSVAFVGTRATIWFGAVIVPLTGLAPVKVTVVAPLTKLPPNILTEVG